ncbi:MAG TPA: sigma-70 family RNA polymerase sigma factor [Patescibacteria group bacterium]|nr:sigma-70 family RNA polymerase sigma factor [Patescibacteria group bacterium]
MKSPRFDSLYKKYSPILFKFIAKHLRKDEAAVEEVFEETIVAAWKGYKTFGHKSSYFTWLCRIALNKIADYYHDQVNTSSRFIVPLLDSLSYIDSTNLSPEESLALKELKLSVNDCLNLLPYEKRRLLWFRYWKDYSYEQIGKILGISERAVEGRIYRAKEDFAKNWSTISNFEPKNS